ncbi:uncharacterized protein LOC121070861 isoform X2 [Cygnus olor]|uniref:uncharacterized protein LOC121070861 isoform X2 n=1 Tax=Cygnus olor TaxID=8869 RepID=UPI001ADEA035|nr:uncharacterized protein LOC121070861 isoform X2 [Cygnus olor]
MLLRLVLLFQPESHSDGTRPRHTPGLTALDHSAGRKSCQRSPGQVRSPQPTPYHALTASSQVTRSGQDGSDRSIRTTGHGQPTAPSGRRDTDSRPLHQDDGTRTASPESHSDGTRPRHNPGLSPLQNSAGKPANTLQDSDRSIRTTGHGQPRQNHTAMGPDHGTILASLPFRTQLENLPTLSRTVTAPSGRRDTDSLGETLETLGHRGRGCPWPWADAAPFGASSLSARITQRWDQTTAHSWPHCPRPLSWKEELPTLSRTGKIAPTHTHHGPQQAAS